MMLQGKKFVIFAGVTGSGRATAEIAAREGASVVTMSRALPTDERAAKTIEACEKLGNGAFKHIKCDASIKDDVDRAMKEAISFLGGIDALVLSQATDHIIASDVISTEDIQKDLDSALFGTMYACQAAFPYMKGNGGSIITFGANAMSVGLPNYAAYNAGKGAIVGISRTLAREWAPYNIRVNIVAPMVFTEISKVYLATATPEQIAESTKCVDSILLGGPEKKGYDRMGTAADCGELVAFLCSDRGKFISGQYINVDGAATFGRI